ncbi:MAG: diguanylate cyclase [Burkholderiales bacterium]
MKPGVSRDFKLPLRWALIVPYVALVLMLALVVGLLSYRAADRAVSVVLDHLLEEVAGRIGQAVDRHVVGSGAALEAAFPDGLAAPTDIETELPALRTRFWTATSLHIDPNNYVYYGNTAGQAFGLFRHSLQEAELRVKLNPDEKRKIYRFRGIAGDLKLEREEERLFDPRERPWYKAGQTNKADTWTSVYIDFGTRELVATRARRVLDAGGNFAGVVASDMSLKQLNQFVRNLKVSPHGIAFILEPNGDLIASSVSPNVETSADGTHSRIGAGNSGNPLLAQVYAAVRQRMQTRATTDPAPAQPVLPARNAEVLDFTAADGQRIHAAFGQVRDTAGLDWHTVVAAPRGDFMQGVGANVIQTVLIALAAALLTVITGLAILSRVAGDLERLSAAARRVGEGELNTPVGIARHDEIGDLARSFEAMQQRLQTDKLTGLANRESLTLQLAQAIERYRHGPGDAFFGLLFIDLDDFKQINDRLGHEAGDRALIEVGDRLKAMVRSSDSVARYAGDEFAILVRDIDGRAALKAIREQIRNGLAGPLQCLDPADAAAIELGSSVGEAFFPGDGDNPAALIAHADRDMYAAKFASKGRVATSAASERNRYYKDS